MKDKRRLWLKAKRAALGINQNDISKKLGIPQSTYACYETGTRNPTPINAMKLSKFFGVPMEEFYKENIA